MAEKMSTLIVVVDLDCRKCYHKIRKILCQLQDLERIRTISFDDKSKTVTMVGPFDPLRLACKLRCKGGKVVRDVCIVDANGGKPPPQNAPDDGPPAPAPVRSGKNKKKKKPPQPQTERPPSPPPLETAPPETMVPPETAPPEMMVPPSPVHHHPPPPPDHGMSAVVPQPQYVEERPPKAELEPPMSPPPKEMRPPMDLPPAPAPHHHPPMPMPVNERPPPPMLMPAECVIPTVEIPSWPAPPVGPCGCPCCAPCYQGYYESCRCHCCGGRLYGTTVRPLPAPCAYRGCRTFSDDDPSAACSVM